MYLLNISSNNNPKFYIGSCLNCLSELGDMYVSEVFLSADRQGSELPYYSCCIKISHKIDLEGLQQLTKEMEVKLGRDTVQTESIAIDIDVLAYKTKADTVWQFLEKRLPLTDDVIWGLTDLEIDFAHVAEAKPVPESLGWWQDE